MPAQAQRQLQVSLEAHGRYITSLIQKGGHGRLPQQTQEALEAALGPPASGILPSCTQDS